MQCPQESEERVFGKKTELRWITLRRIDLGVCHN
jgi:hypothetical protein